MTEVPNKENQEDSTNICQNEDKNIELMNIATTSNDQTNYQDDETEADKTRPLICGY